MSASGNFWRTALIAVIFLAIGFALGQKKVEVDKKGIIPKISVVNQVPPQEQEIDFSLFWEVFETLPQKYIEKSAVSGQKMLYGAISGMVRSLGDPYTAFLDPKQNEAVKSELSGSYEGVGIQIGFNKDKRLVVISPLSQTPAAAAGLLPRDLVLKIDGRDTFDITLPEAVDLIRGPAGSRVKLVLQHDGESETYEQEIERAKIKVKSVELVFRDTSKGKVAVVKVLRFGEKTTTEWDAAVDDILAQKEVGVVVDMRNNPGGLLSSAVELASDFVSGTVVKEEFADGSVQSVGASRSGRLREVKMAVLINGGSASASEIFAGAIQDHGRGKVVGEKSFGKGTVQDVVDFSGGSGLHVTIARWLTPNGNSINGTGITPDVIIEAEKDLSADRQDKGEEKEKVDAQLEKAIEVLGT